MPPCRGSLAPKQLCFRAAWFLLSSGLLPTASQAPIEKIFAGFSSSTAPGAAVLVVKDGQAVFERGYGVTDLRSMHKIDKDTNFRLASVSKQHHRHGGDVASARWKAPLHGS